MTNLAKFANRSGRIAEGGVASLLKVIPGPCARELAEKYGKDPRGMELIIGTYDWIMGGTLGVVLRSRTAFSTPKPG